MRRWVKEFDEKFNTINDCSSSQFEHEEFCQGCITLVQDDADDIKDFIHSLLADQRKEIAGELFDVADKIDEANSKLEFGNKKIHRPKYRAMLHELWSAMMAYKNG